MPEIISWRFLAKQVGATRQRTSKGAGWTEVGSSDLAQEAIDILLEEENLGAAVDHYFSQKTGSELVRNIL